MRTFQLTKGYETIVDDEDYDFLMQWNWYALATPLIYATRHSPRVNGKQGRIYMHRLLCAPPDGMDTDHRNGDTLDNRRGNLRVATRTQNCRNRAPLTGCTSIHKGVCWNKNSNKWQATIRLGGKSRYLGLFADELAAARAYDEMARKEWGEFHRTSGDVIA